MRQAPGGAEADGGDFATGAEQRNLIAQAARDFAVYHPVFELARASAHAPRLEAIARPASPQSQFAAGRQNKRHARFAVAGFGANAN